MESVNPFFRAPDQPLEQRIKMLFADSLFQKAITMIPDADLVYIKEATGANADELPNWAFKLAALRWMNPICEQCFDKSDPGKFQPCACCGLAFYCSSSCKEQHQAKHAERCCRPDGPRDEGPNAFALLQTTASQADLFAHWSQLFEKYGGGEYNAESRCFEFSQPLMVRIRCQGAPMKDLQTPDSPLQLALFLNNATDVHVMRERQRVNNIDRMVQAAISTNAKLMAQLAQQANMELGKCRVDFASILGPSRQVTFLPVQELHVQDHQGYELPIQLSIVHNVDAIVYVTGAVLEQCNSDGLRFAMQAVLRQVRLVGTNASFAHVFEKKLAQPPQWAALQGAWVDEALPGAVSTADAPNEPTSKAPIEPTDNAPEELNHNTPNEPTMAECSICFEVFNEKLVRVVLIPCGHTEFCQNCIAQLESDQCPICAQAFQQFLPIFV